MWQTLLTGDLEILNQCENDVFVCLSYKKPSIEKISLQHMSMASTNVVVVLIEYWDSKNGNSVLW